MRVFIPREEYNTTTQKGMHVLKTKKEAVHVPAVEKMLKKIKLPPLPPQALVDMNQSYFYKHVELTRQLFRSCGVKAYKVVNYPHLGLGLKICEIYTKAELHRRCFAFPDKFIRKCKHMPSCECSDCDYVHFGRSIGASAAHMINCIYIVAEQSICLHIVIHMLLGMTHSHTHKMMDVAK